MDKPNNKSTKHLNLYAKGKSKLYLGGFIVFLIALTPILFYSYESFPDSQIWETPFFTLETSFPDWYSFAWYFTGKAIPLFLLLLWFFTCKHWWHWIILVPISMYSFQLWAVINESNDLDEIELIYILPLMMVLVPFVYLIRAQLFNKLVDKDLKSFEKDLLQKKSIWQQIRDLFR
ncbi:hypothetical protein [Cochleicola gelatinilyticus]|uniref:Uncharacterized protein n=1 Tax=Cochleicola gelatinilyticus TaxID=1763537 RepID=A0A167H0R5_9FLAO|nr:hypothetical protein [Cochleicola gelatinilyticus]OAB78091.1 hypothetical protein ULVI_11455 [Cochleicola gelatinilyticus]